MSHHHEHAKEDILIREEETKLVVAHGRHIFHFATPRVPKNVYTTIESNDQQGCGNDMDHDTVEVCLHPFGFDLVVNCTSDSCNVGYIVEA